LESLEEFHQGPLALPTNDEIHVSVIQHRLGRSWDMGSIHNDRHLQVLPDLTRASQRLPGHIFAHPFKGSAQMIIMVKLIESSRRSQEIIPCLLDPVWILSAYARPCKHNISGPGGKGSCFDKTKRLR
jgi:hypothetical protein